MKVHFSQNVAMTTNKMFDDYFLNFSLNFDKTCLARTDESLIDVMVPGIDAVTAGLREHLSPFSAVLGASNQACGVYFSVPHGQPGFLKVIQQLSGCFYDISKTCVATNACQAQHSQIYDPDRFSFRINIARIFS